MKFELETPLIAAVRTEREFLRALKSTVELIFLLSANLNQISGCAERAHAAGKKLFFHIDFVEGLGKDRCGLAFLKENGGDGVITTKTHLVLLAKELGLFTVQRFFLIDSRSVATALDTAGQSFPDLIELMPGVIASELETFRKKGRDNVIAGGLIRDKQAVMAALKAGAVAVSTSREELWYL